jgi:hypothetical protein
LSMISSISFHLSEVDAFSPELAQSCGAHAIGSPQPLDPDRRVRRVILSGGYLGSLSRAEPCYRPVYLGTATVPLPSSGDGTTTRLGGRVVGVIASPLGLFQPTRFSHARHVSANFAFASSSEAQNP